MTEYNLYYIIIAGDPATGPLTYVGPFDNEEDAEKEANSAYPEQTIEIVELQQPMNAV